VPIAYDPEQLAIDTILEFDRILRESIGRSKCKSLSRRAAEAPQLLQQTGLVTEALFYISKSDDNLLKTLVELLEHRGKVENNSIRSLSDECEREGKGHTVLLAILAKALRRLASQGLLDEAGKECIEVNDTRTIAKCLKALREWGVELRAEKLLQPFLVAVKRLTEALYGEK